MQLGANWQQIRQALQPFDTAILVGVIVLFLGLLWWRLGHARAPEARADASRPKRAEVAPPEPEASPPGPRPDLRTRAPRRRAAGARCR